MILRKVIEMVKNQNINILYSGENIKDFINFAFEVPNLKMQDDDFEKNEIV